MSSTVNYFPQTPYQYKYAKSSTPLNNITVYTGNNKANYSMKIDLNNMTSTGKLPYEVPLTKNKIGTKVINAGKRVFSGMKPGQAIMLGVMLFAIFARAGLTSSTSTAEARSNTNQIEQAYKMGEQHIRDSIKNAHLEKELQMAKNTLKVFKK